MPKPRNKIKAVPRPVSTLSEARVLTKTSTASRAENQPSKQPAKPSKQSRVIELLRSPKGTTIDAMMKVTGWQQHSVRGFLAGVLRKRLKLKLDSRLVDGKRMYRIVGAASAKPNRSLAKPR